MSTTRADLVDFAEAPSLFIPERANRVIRLDDRFALYADVGTTYCAVEQIRLREAELADAIAEVDAFMHETDTTVASWWLTERSTPGEDAFLAAGLRRDEDDYLHAAMVLADEPQPSELQARRVETFEEYVEARLVQREVFANVHQRERDYEAEWAQPRDPLFAAWVDGRIASVGRATFGSVGVFLTGGATARWARGRGGYRATVRARWDAAVAAGTPVLAVGAGPLSRPILERLGFEQVLQCRRLESVRSGHGD